MLPRLPDQAHGLVLVADMNVTAGDLGSFLGEQQCGGPPLARSRCR